MNCTTTGDDGPIIPCTDIPSEESFVCVCPECVRELQFTYSGSACESDFASSGKCTDTVPTPEIADILCTDAAQPEVPIVSGTYEKGETVVIGASSGSCLPDVIVCSIASTEGLLAQTFEIDSSCDGGRGLVLVDNYGAFTSIGYSCDAEERHNCLTEVAYELEVCNRGVDEEIIYDWDFILNGAVTDLLAGIEDTSLLTDECLDAIVTEVVNRCEEVEYCAESTANATDPATGLPSNCDDSEELCFEFNTPPLPPSPMPR